MRFLKNVIYIENSILEAIRQNSCCLKDIDTIIIYTDPNMDMHGDGISIFIEKVSIFEKNIVFLCGYSKNEYLDVKIKSPIRIYHPVAYIKGIENLKRKKHVVDIPIVAFYDYSGRYAAAILSALKSLFRDNGFYAVGISDSYTAAFYGLEFIPHNFNTDIYLSDAYTKYDCDLFWFKFLKTDIGGIRRMLLMLK